MRPGVIEMAGVNATPVLAARLWRRPFTPNRLQRESVGF